jgi:GH24 family phage-related lysozyme (muramidase)
MGTWIKHTDLAMYLMQGGVWLSRITKSDSTSNPQEQVLDVTGMAAWFDRPDYPTAMTISLGTGAPEPEPWQPPQNGQINAAGLALIKEFEGLRTTAYRDPVGIWTIGYGHTSMAGPPEVTSGMRITEADAEEILKRDLRKFEQGIRDRVSVSLNSNQFSALVSFAFNVGLGAFQNSTMRRLLNGGDYSGAANEFPRWVKAGGRTLQGLVRRRNAERALFLSQDYSQFL